MSQNLPVYIIIVAGGQGTRMGTAIPKQFLPLNGKPVLYYSIHAFAHALPDAHLILVLPEQHISYAQTVLQSMEERIDLTIVSGGETRFHSVKNGLASVDPAHESIVFVHDGARPLISRDLILHCYHEAKEKGSAIPAIAVSDSLRMVDGKKTYPADREKMRAIQTPQVFLSSILIPAFAECHNSSFTDEATVAEAHGTEIFLVEGERSNIKITTAEDMIIAEAFLKRKINE